MGELQRSVWEYLWREVWWGLSLNEREMVKNDIWSDSEKAN